MTNLVMGKDEKSTPNNAIELSNSKFTATLQSALANSTLLVPADASLMKINIEAGKNCQYAIGEDVTQSVSHLFTSSNHDMPEDGSVRRVIPGTTLHFHTFFDECKIVVQFFSR
jgi:hypothetical protein